MPPVVVDGTRIKLVGVTAMTIMMMHHLAAAAAVFTTIMRSAVGLSVGPQLGR